MPPKKEKNVAPILVPRGVTIVSKKNKSDNSDKTDKLIKLTGLETSMKSVKTNKQKGGNFNLDVRNNSEDDTFSNDIIEESDFESAQESDDGDVSDVEELITTKKADVNNEEDVEENDENEKEELLTEDEEGPEEEPILEEEEDEEDKLDNDIDYGDEENFGENEGGEGGDDSCLYKFNKKNFDDDDIEEEVELHFEDDDIVADEIVTNPEDREAKAILTKYERVRILGDRTKQLSLGAKPMLIVGDDMQPKEIARLELEKGVIPFIIEKTLPNGRRERWKVSELEIVN